MTSRHKGLSLLSKYKLFMRLSQSGCFAGRETVQGNSSGWILFKENSNGIVVGVGRIATSIMKSLLSDGVLFEKNGKAVLTDAGRVAIRRLLVNHDSCLGQHQSREEEALEISGVSQPVTINRAESPLSWLASRKGRDGKPMVQAIQLLAGERLRSDFERGAMGANVTCNWESLALPKMKSHAGNFEGLSFTEAGMAARSRVVIAIREVGPELSGVLIDVCCEQKGLVDAEKHNGWPKRSGKVILGMALDRLARHYGLIGEENAAPYEGRQGGSGWGGSTWGGSTWGRSRITHWGADDFRPVIDG